MLESTFNSGIVYYLMGVVTIGGMVSKLIVSIVLKKLVRAASDMSKSTHGFMKLVRAKFEHACMINDKVENVDVFVDKYLQEYQVWGLRLQGWKRLERICILLVGALTLFAVGNTYYYVGWGEVMLQQTVIGVIAIIFLFGIYQLVDEQMRIQTVKVYMVDYLENVCAHRFMRNNSAKEKIVVPNLAESENKEKDSAIALDEQLSNIELKLRIAEQDMLLQDQPVTQQISQQMQERRVLQQSAQEEAEKREELRKQKQEEYMPNEAAIREILQEFMA